MITVQEAKTLCHEKYLSLWGKDWIKKKIGSFIDDTMIPSGTNTMYYGIAQDDSWDRKKPITFEEFSKVTFGGDSGWKQQHYSQFKVDLETGELETLEHY